jgi:probable HAF family extracellular repeat protein
MKRTLTTATILIGALAVPLRSAAQDPTAPGQRPKYLIVNLPDTIGGTVGAANAVNNRGWAMGAATLPGNTTEHATVWIYGKAMDLGTLGGPNSSVAWSSVKNDNGVIAGVSDTSIVDPLGEVWSCAEAFFPSSSGHTCQGFVWQDHTMSALPTLGGNNGVATGVNNLGQIAGWAETTTHDPTCISPQVLQFEAVVYGANGEIQRQLAPFPGDSDSAATDINNLGQVVGISGICANAVGGASAAHAVLWENGTPTNIGNLGGVAWNTPTAINNHGVIVGFSDLPGDSAASPNYHAFIWTKSAGIADLGTLPGDSLSIAWGINDQGQVVGQSIDASGSSRAFFWQNGVMTDLNTLVAQGPLSLVYANDINDSGEIVGGAYNSTTTDSPAFMAVPIRTQ